MPSPNPLWRRLMELSACRKRSNTYGRKSAGMPMPLSLTKISASLSPGVSPTVTWPPFGVNFKAFDNRFHTTC